MLWLIIVFFWYCLPHLVDRNVLSSYSVFSFQRSLSSENNAILDRKIQIMWPCPFLLKLCFSQNFRMMSDSKWVQTPCSFSLANVWDSVLEILYHCWHCVVLLSSKKIPHKTKGLEQSDMLFKIQTQAAHSSIIIHLNPVWQNVFNTLRYFLGSM